PDNRYLHSFPTRRSSDLSQEALFQKERFGKSLKYAIPVPNGTYTVQTYHVETYFGRGTVPQKAGQRVFDISLEGKVVKDDFDLLDRKSTRLNPSHVKISY